MNQSLRYFMKLISQYPVIENDELVELCINNDPQFEEIAIKSNLRLVWKIANDYKGVDQMELLSAGVEGLAKATERWDPIEYPNTKFSTYASWWINSKILERICQIKNLVRMPTTVYNKSKRITRAVDECDRKGLDPTVKRLIEMTGESERLIKHILNHSKGYVYLDDSSFDNIDGTSNHEIFTVDKKDRKPSKETKKLIYKFLHTFDKRVREMITLKYGLEDDKPQTLEEISLVFGVSRERVRQIISKALLEMKCMFEEIGITNEDEC